MVVDASGNKHARDGKFAGHIRTGSGQIEGLAQSTIENDSQARREQFGKDQKYFREVYNLDDIMNAKDLDDVYASRNTGEFMAYAGKFNIAARDIEKPQVWDDESVEQYLNDVSKQAAYYEAKQQEILGTVESDEEGWAGQFSGLEYEDRDKHFRGKFQEMKDAGLIQDDVHIDISSEYSSYSGNETVNLTVTSDTPWTPQKMAETRQMLGEMAEAYTYSSDDYTNIYVQRSFEGPRQYTPSDFRQGGPVDRDTVFVGAFVRYSDIDNQNEPVKKVVEKKAERWGTEYILEDVYTGERSESSLSTNWTYQLSSMD